MTTAQGEQFALLREIQKDIAENKAAVAAATATLVALADSYPPAARARDPQQMRHCWWRI